MADTADAALTPELALRYLEELSTDIRAAILIGSDGAVAAASGKLEERRDPAAELVRQLFHRAEAAGGEAPSQVEVTLPEGAVFAVRQGPWTVATVTSRLALPSLMFYDLRTVLSDLERQTP